VTVSDNAAYRKRSRYGAYLALLLPIFSLFTSIALSQTQVWATDPPADEPPQTVISDESPTADEDTTSPVITTNVEPASTLNGTYHIVMMTDDPNPRDPSIQLLRANGSPVLVGGNELGPFQGTASGSEFAYDWDTTKFANGDYLLKFNVSDLTGNTAAEKTVAVTVLNAGSEPAYPPITPVLDPIPIAEAIRPVPPRGHAGQSHQDVDNPDKDQPKNTQKDVLAARIRDAEVATHENDVTPRDTCALFFGTCWFWSVPGTVIVGGIAYVVYKARFKMS